MPKVVLDTNVLVSGLLWKDGPQAKLLQLARLGKFEVILSLEIITELHDVLLRPKFRLTEEEVDKAIKEILKFCKVVVPNSKLNVVKEGPSDNMVIETAVASSADFIVSGDAHLLNLKTYESIKIVNTFEFFKELFRD